ncbi:MAG: S-layer protein [Candidatus Aenigmarchaeota archaeon]|nr:S-layer protein [Candidatus Aenigmarchaeota archaeon]
MDSGLRLNVRNNMYKKFVAGFMTALMAAMTLVSPVLGATALSTYPTFLGKVGDFYVVVGKDAAASDVAGAIDVAANLAQLSYKDTTVSGTTSSGLTGVERKVSIPASSTTGAIAGTTGNNLPVTLKNFHYSGLKEGQFDYKGTNYNYHEEVVLNDTDPKLKLTHSISSPINGTLKMRIDNGGLKYQYVFDSTISNSSFGPATTANSSTYQNPVKVMVAGREFQIVAVPDTGSFKSLVGSVKTLSDGEAMTVEGLTLKVVQSFSSTTAKLEVTDASGNVVKSGINTGSQESFTSGGATWNYKVLSSGATASGVAGYAQVLFGKGDVEKTFDGSDTSTVTEFGSNWKISGVFKGAGVITAGDKIRVEYSPSSLTDDTRYYLQGSSLKGPNNYFELKYVAYEPSKFAKVTIESVTGVTVYNSTAATGYSTSDFGGASGLNGLKISSDVAGTIVNGSTGYDEMYVLFNGSSSAAEWLGIGNRSTWWLAFKDKATSRVVNADQTDAASQWPAVMNGGAAGGIFNVSLSYGGPGAVSAFYLVANFHNGTLLDGVKLYSAGDVQQVNMSFTNRSIAATSSPPELRLGGTTAKADTNDVTARIEGTATQDVSDQVGTLVTDGGIQVYTVKTNTDGDKVVLGIPPETVYGLVQFGKIGAATSTTGEKVKEVVAVTTAVAKLDSEVAAGDKTGKHLILVGGPCKNSLVADLKTAGKFAYGCTDWPARNFGVIEVVDGAFATGKQVVVVAGTRAEDTRLASGVLQSYATKLTGVTASKVEVTGTVAATATVTPA